MIAHCKLCFTTAFMKKPSASGSLLAKPRVRCAWAEDYVVIADLPKRPEYDQIQLKLAVETLRRWGENPDDYVTTDIKVSEAKYNAWPPGIRELFEPARTLKTGKATYTLVAPSHNLSEVA